MIIVTMSPAPARWVAVICPCGVIIEASVEPAPRSRMASGLDVPGVVSAPKMAASASAPPTCTSTCSFCSISWAIMAICRRSDLTIEAMPTACSSENSPASPPVTLTGTAVSTASRSWINTSLLGLLVSSAMVWRTCSSMPPILVPASPVTLSSVGHSFTAFMMASAPAATSTLSVLPLAISSIFPAGIERAFTSPEGVFTTTAERLPISALATGTMLRVSSALREKTVAMP